MAVEKLPKSGIKMVAVHDDGIRHEWVRYDSITQIGKHPPNKPNPKRIVCPKCGKRGRINAFRNSKNTKIAYLVVHEKLPGYWGKSAVPKRRRCYIRDPDHRDIILKKLGRYINQPNSN